MFWTSWVIIHEINPSIIHTPIIPQDAEKVKEKMNECQKRDRESPQRNENPVTVSGKLLFFVLVEKLAGTCPIFTTDFPQPEQSYIVVGFSLIENLSPQPIINV